jgi:hypothetical protein
MRVMTILLPSKNHKQTLSDKRLHKALLNKVCKEQNGQLAEHSAKRMELSSFLALEDLRQPRHNHKILRRLGSRSTRNPRSR